MTAAETQAAIRAAAEALYPVLVEHSKNGAGCPCVACRAWISLWEDCDMEYAHGLALVWNERGFYRHEGVRP